MHSIAIQLGPLTIYWYGILTAAGFLSAFWWAARRAPAAGLRPETVTGLAPWLVLGALVGARLFYVITFWNDEFAGRPLYNILMVRSGLVFYGGLIGASLGTAIHARIHKVPLWKLADLLAPAIALGHAFGRVGCLMTGCCYGRACTLPWAIHFPNDHWTQGEGVHPTQLYEAALNLILFFALAWLQPRKRFDGHVFGVYLVAYALLRSVVESFRGDYAASAYFLGVLSPAQAVSVGTGAAGIVLLWLLRPRTRRHAG